MALWIWCCSWFCISFSLVSVGPFKINGVPLRRVNQAYVIGTSTKVDISQVNTDKFDDKYFTKEKKKTAKKSEGEFFESEKEVCPCPYQYVDQLQVFYKFIALFLPLLFP